MSEMTIREALFEFAAAYDDLVEILQTQDVSRETLIAQVNEAYDLDEARDVMEREHIQREKGFEPYSARQ